MRLQKRKLEKLPLFSLHSHTLNHGGSIYQYDGMLYKVFDDSSFFEDEVERNIDYQIKNYIPNTPHIYDKIYIHRKFCGYCMEYLMNTMTFREAIYKDSSFSVKVSAILDIYKTIKYLHSRDIFIGDIHMDNFLMNDQDGYVVDLDYMIMKGNEFKFQDLYSVKFNSNSNSSIVSNKRTDNVKAMICCLSLLLGVDLEKECIYRSVINVEDIYDKYIRYLKLEDVDCYFRDLMNGNESLYFDDFLRENGKVLRKICSNERKK